MTNADIIFAESQRLAKAGAIKYTGREFKAVDAAGKEIIVKETEPIHTYQIWKSLGYQVQKGEKAVAKITIWKHTGPKVETLPMADGSENHYVDKGKMFMKTAAFFSQSQVAAVEA